MPTFKPSRRIYSSYNSTLMTEQTNIKWDFTKGIVSRRVRRDFPVKCCRSPSVLFYFILTIINSYPLSYRVFSPSCDLRCKVKQPFVRIISKKENTIIHSQKWWFCSYPWTPWELIVKWNSTRGEHYQFCTYYYQ